MLKYKKSSPFNNYRAIFYSQLFHDFLHGFLLNIPHKTLAAWGDDIKSMIALQKKNT